MPARLVVLIVFLTLFTVVPSAVDLLTEWFWFGEVGYTSIFARTLITKVSLGGVVFLLAFGALAVNLRRALQRVTEPYVLFPGGGDIKP